MHLVFVSSLVPAGVPESGYEIANQAIIDALRRKGVRVSILGFKWPGATLSDPQNTHCLGEVDVRTDTAGGAQKLRWLATALANGLTFSSAKLRIVPEARIRAALAELAPFDGLVLNGVPLAGAFTRVFAQHPSIFVAHNVEHLTARENAAEASGLAERLLYAREARVLKRLERGLCTRARYVLTLAENDLKPLGVAPGKGAALPLVTPDAGLQSGARTPAFDIGMIGTWTWAPNRIGLEWFLQNVLPKLHPAVTVAVAGTMPKGFPARDKRVLFLGRVQDAKEFLRQCRVVALTARAGTGVQLKTIETFELGLPAVATASSLRGIAAVPANVHTADDPAAFAEALHAQIVGQRTGKVPDLDGSAFRAAQVKRMDAVVADALKTLGFQPDSGGARD